MSQDVKIQVLTLPLKHQEVLSFVLQYQDQHGERPMLKEISAGCCISTGFASEIMTALKASGELSGPLYGAKTKAVSA